MRFMLISLVGLCLSLSSFAADNGRLSISIGGGPTIQRDGLPQNPDNPPPYPGPPGPPGHGGPGNPGPGYPPPGGGNYYYSFNFGPTPVNSIRYTYITLTSTGSGNLYLDDITLWGAGFWGRWNCPRVMPPGAQCSVYVEFRPWYEGNFSGRLTFCTSAGNYIMDLFGWGTRW